MPIRKLLYLQRTVGINILYPDLDIVLVLVITGNDENVE